MNCQRVPHEENRCKSKNPSVSVIQWKNLAELARTGTPPKTLAEFQRMLANIRRQSG
jgi:hypothetical protein